MPAIGGHQRTQGRTDEWITPPSLLRALGAFDLDPCASADQPWPTAAEMWTAKDDGLGRDWFGRVFCNPPYGHVVGKWLARLAQHGDGIALVFARTDTRAFERWVWSKAAACFFITGRLYFYHPDGTRAKSSAGAPSVLIAYGNQNVRALHALPDQGIRGSFVWLRTQEPVRVGRVTK
jgi:hypothetical protein